MTNIKYWNRIGHVEVQDASGKMISYAGLDFKFHAKYKFNSYQDFSVSILGLSSDTINDLTVWHPDDAFRDPRKINVYAGYEDTGEQLIASGYVWTATPTSPPEMWMNFDCKRWLTEEKYVENEEVFTDISYIDAFNIICARGNMPAKYAASDPNKKIARFEVSGHVGRLTRKFAKIVNKNVYSKYGALVCVDKHMERDAPKREVYVNESTGLLATGNIDMKGAVIVTRLRTDINIDDWIRLESALIPSANGPYYTAEAEYIGHLRGEEWESRFKCFRHVE